MEQYESGTTCCFGFFKRTKSNKISNAINKSTSFADTSGVMK